MPPSQPRLRSLPAASQSVAAALMVCLLLTVSLMVLQAQPSEDTYPTVTALSKALITPRDRVALARALQGIDPGAPSTVRVQYTLGEMRTFTAVGDNRIFDVQAELLAMGEHIYIWVETGAGITTEAAEALAKAFDTRIYHQARDLWGSEASPGIDGDPRIHALFAYGLSAGTGAYFSTDNTYPQRVIASSNEHEMFFYNLSAIGTNIANAPVESITAHEFQHMIRANAASGIDTWLDEGFSMFTEVYLGYYPDMGLAERFLDNPDTQLNTWAEFGPRDVHYGASMLFVSYFYDRFGVEALRAVSQSPQRSLDAFDSVLRDLGEPGLRDFFADWVIANYIHDESVGDGRFTYRSIPLTFTPRTQQAISTYPAQVAGEANQFSADYFVLRGLPADGALTLALDAPESVGLIAASAYSGSHFWYSNRADDSSTTLTRAFDLTQVRTATLEYRAWMHIEALWDYAYVMVSTDAGESWVVLQTPHTTSDNPYGTAYGPGYTGDSEGWFEEAVSLDAFAGQQILVRFQMISDDALSQPGFALDDVRLAAVDYFSDFEVNNGGWQSEGWVWTDNRLPQEIWIQAIHEDASGSRVVTRWLSPTAETMRVPLYAHTSRVVLAVSPVAPLTTVPVPYTLTITAGD